MICLGVLVGLGVGDCVGVDLGVGDGVGVGVEMGLGVGEAVVAGTWLEVAFTLSICMVPAELTSM
jgi:hypothetical protein